MIDFLSLWQGYNPVEYLEFFANRDYQVACRNFSQFFAIFRNLLQFFAHHDYQVAYRHVPQSVSDQWTLN
jgi:hypothetical protein